jgi:hypothetical protein
MEAKIPSKQATLIWRILNQALPVKDKLVSKGIRCSPICPRCNNVVETTNHVFMHCECAKAVLFGSINFQSVYQELSFCDWLSNMITNEQKGGIENIVAIIYHMWRARNLLVFQNNELPVMSVVQQAITSAKEYQVLCRTQNNSSQSSDARSRGHNMIQKDISNL